MNRTTYQQFRRLQKLCIANGFDPQVVYCSITGRPIGRFDDSIIVEALSEIGPQADEEEMMDDLLTRTLSSMRPSPNWNMITRDSLNRRVKSAPAQALSYLLIRLYSPHSGLKQTFMERTREYLRRVSIYRFCEVLCQSEDERVKEWMFLLIEIDALYNLTSLPVPGNDILVMLADVAGASGIGDFASQMEAFMGGWRTWHRKLYESYELKLRAALRQDTWIKGNPGASSARTTLFFEQKPKSEATVKREAKGKADAQMTNLLRALMDERVEAEPKPEAPKGFFANFGGLKIEGAGA